jgi:hypothetical protein
MTATGADSDPFGLGLDFGLVAAVGISRTLVFLNFNRALT